MNINILMDVARLLFYFFCIHIILSLTDERDRLKRQMWELEIEVGRQYQELEELKGLTVYKRKRSSPDEAEALV